MKPILVDCDGVLSDMTRAVLELARTKANIFRQPEDIVEWDFSKALGWPACSYAITEAVEKREFCFRMKPYEGALGFLRVLETHYGPENVLVCTSPWNPSWAAQRYAWLERYGVDKSRVIMTTEKHRIPGLLVDDGPPNLARHPDAVVCIERPWNADRLWAKNRTQAAVAKTYTEALQLIASELV